MDESEIKDAIGTKKDCTIWTIGITDDPDRRKSEHENDGKSVKYWKHWKADSETKRLEEMKANGSPYVDGFQVWLDFALTIEQGDPFDVADVALQALSDQPMARRYLIVPNEKEMSWVMDNLVDRLADLNRNNEFSWTPEKIARDVDAAIARKEAERQ